MFYTVLVRARYIVPLLCLLLFPLYAAPRGAELSRALETTLLQQGFVPVREPLSATAEDGFPFNLQVDFYPATDSVPSLLSAENTFENKRNLVIFAFTQEDAYDYAEAVLSLLTHLQQTPPQCQTIVLFSANERSPVGTPSPRAGTEVFAQQFDEGDRAAAVAVSFSPGSRASVNINSQGRTAPLWLTRALTESLHSQQVAYAYPNYFAALYRLGLLKSDARLFALIANNIPAVAVSFSAGDELRALQTFSDTYTTDQTELWDSHYLYFRLPAPFKPLWIGEQFFFLFCLLLGTVLLLIFCTATFTGKNGRHYKQDFLHSWYLIPLTIALTFVSLWLGQTLCKAVPLLARAAPVVQFGIKLIVTLLVTAVLFAIQEYSQISSVQFTHGYFIYIIAVCNIFVFSAVDLLFFVTFLAEYLFIYIARKAVRIVPLIISVVLMLVPFIPYVYQLVRYGSYRELQPLVFCTPLVNLLLALLLFPFLIMWLRMIVRMEIYAAGNNFSAKKMVVNGSISTGIVIAITVVFVVVLALLSSRAGKQTQEGQISVSNENRYTFTIDTSKDQFLGMTTRHIHVASKEAALRYEVSISSEHSVPLYDSTYDYTLNEETQTATFTLPDYPPTDLTIDYAADSRDDATIFVTAWYAENDGRTVRKESHAHLVMGEK